MDCLLLFIDYFAVVKVLIIRFSSIGDIVLTTPVIRCVKTQLNCELHFITKPENASILSQNPYIDKLHFLQPSLWQTISELRKESFDYIIDLHNNQRTFLIKLALGTPSSSFPKINFEKWLMTQFKINRLPEEHIVDRYFKGVKKMSIFNDGKGLDFFYDNNLPRLEARPYIAWAIGAKQKTKQFPAEKIIETLNRNDFPNMPILFLGGKEDAAKGEYIIAQSPRKNEQNFAGKLSLIESAHVIAKSELLITNDTGLMHIGAALKKPIVSVWGNTIPEFGMTPYYGNTKVNNEIIEVKNLSCRPCSKLGYGSCPQGHFDCMNKISECDLASAVSKVFSEK